ncbi:hypothetical protein [Acetobacter sp.]|uniref:hypothetical protein n=1 Tax=Acetobacter sp. TaxID=440 RepID=UPI0039E7FA5F
MVYSHAFTLDFDFILSRAAIVNSGSFVFGFFAIFAISMANRPCSHLRRILAFVANCSKKADLMTMDGSGASDQIIGIFGGEGGIRTLGTIASSTVFETEYAPLILLDIFTNALIYKDLISI